MDFIDQIKALAVRGAKKLDHLQTEEATKTALIMPFINALGYNVFNPTEVVPEYTADVGIKKGEKVDYAIMKDGEPIMLFECKSARTDLDDVHALQLYRYFLVTSARIGVLTNGMVYRFYSDLDAPNRMDARPFLEVDIFQLEDALIPELKKLTKTQFDENSIIETAGAAEVHSRNQAHPRRPAHGARRGVRPLLRRPGLQRSRHAIRSRPVQRPRAASLPALHQRSDQRATEIGPRPR